MRGALACLVIAGCGRFGFGGTTTSPDGSAADLDVAIDAPSPRVSTTPYGGETSISVAATPTGFTVVTAPRVGGPLTVQRFTAAWDAIDPDAFQLAQQADLVAIGYGTKLVIVAQDVGATTSTIGTLDESTPPIFTANTALPSPPSESALFTLQANLAVMSPEASGYEWYQIAPDGASVFPVGGAGSGGVSQTCAADGDDTFTYAASVCAKTAGGRCVTGWSVNGGNGGGSFVGECRNPSLVMRGTYAFSVFDANPLMPTGIQIVTWDTSTLGFNSSPQLLLASGDHPQITSDNRGLVIAYRDGAAVMSAIVDPATLQANAPTPVVGVPAAVGMFVVPQGDSTVLLVAAVDGMYRIRI